MHQSPTGVYWRAQAGSSGAGRGRQVGSAGRDEWSGGLRATPNSSATTCRRDGRCVSSGLPL
eukprot:274357-Chlamydomonas_euryale.AAC.12